MSLPQASCLPKPKILYKPYHKGNRVFLEKSGLRHKERQVFRQQVASLSISHQIQSKHLNMPRGQRVTSLLVLAVDLLADDFDRGFLATIDSYLNGYAIYVIKPQKGHITYWVSYKEALSHPKDGQYFKIIKSFESSELTLDWSGQSLDQVYDSIVKSLGREELVDTTADAGTAIQASKERQALEKEVERLRQKMRRAKTARQELAFHKAYKEAKSKLESLTTDR